MFAPPRVISKKKKYPALTRANGKFHKVADVINERPRTIGYHWNRSRIVKFRRKKSIFVTDWHGRALRCFNHNHLKRKTRLHTIFANEGTTHFCRIYWTRLFELIRNYWLKRVPSITFSFSLCLDLLWIFREYNLVAW